MQIGTQNIAQARAYFPRGLFQPAGAFRFSMDALLLAAFAARLAPGWRSMTDLGCGVGPVAFGSILLTLNRTNVAKNTEIMALGLDNQPDLLEAARQNALRLGFDEIFSTRETELGGFEPGELAGSFDLVTANPPYRKPGEGRLPPAPLRRAALFADDEVLRAFLRSGRKLLADNGVFCLVFPYARMAELAALLEAEGLVPFESLYVSAASGEKPLLSLLATRRKNKRIDHLVEKSLVLYGKTAGVGRELSKEALEFCQFLACNAMHKR